METEENKNDAVRPTSGIDDKPLWSHVTVLAVVAGGGGNRTWTCNYCSKKIVGSYSKVKAHLLKLPNHGVALCKSVTTDMLQQIKEEHDEVERKKSQEAYQDRQKADYLSLPQGSDVQQHKKRKGKEVGPLEKSFNISQREKADKQCARMFYASGLPFNFAKSPFSIYYSRTLANSSLAGYTPPTYNRIRTTLLGQEKEHVYKKLQPIRDSWRKKGVSIVSDGWSDRQRRPLINLMAASTGGAMFLKSIDASGTIKDGEYVSKVFEEAIKEVGESNVVQIITDNASNYKSAGSMIESRYPHIFWTPCVVHSLNLALKSICDPTEKSPQYAQCKRISDLVSDVQNIRNFVVNHGMTLAIFNSYSNLSLLRVAETRFASSIIMTKRVREVKGALEKMVMDSDWRIYREGSNEGKAQEIKQCIVNDCWWDKLDYFLKFTEPIVDMLRKADTDTPILHLIYDMWDSMIENVKKIVFKHEQKDLISGSSEFFDVVHQVLESRWNKSNTPLHCMAHSLVPKYYHESWLQSGSNGIPRIAPHEDNEVSMNRSKSLKKLFPNVNDLRKAYSEFGAFSTECGYFNEPHVIDARSYEDPVSWWANHGASTPLLQSLAFKLLAQPASSSCCERNWSTYSYIQNIKRNRLAPSRADDLVFVHYNLRLLSRKEQDYKEGETKYWDLGADKVTLEENAIVELEELSLDDPDLESYFVV